MVEQTLYTFAKVGDHGTQVKPVEIYTTS